jgi:pimeloyl-ACP methyl ester carboxylesterase
MSVAPAAQAQTGSTATVAVPLDHAQPAGPHIQLAYRRFPAREASRGTVVFLAGGPGEAAIRSSRAILDLFDGLRDRHDVVFVDQRGTGLSSPLRCSDAPRGRFDADLTLAEQRRATARCGAELGDARRFYTTYETALDLEDVRAALAVDRIIPLGVSYGGQVAGEYARRFPDRVQALVLDSTSPIEGIDTMQKLPQLALERVYREVCFPPGCGDLLGQPLTLMAEASRRLALRPLGSITAADVYALVMASDQDLLLRTELPAALQAAIKRDGAPLRRLLRYADGGSGSSGINEVRYLATSCVEGNQPWDPASDPAGREALLERHLAENDEDYEPFDADVVAEQLGATQCLSWPSTTRPPLPPGVASAPDLRVLVLAGREDLRTPLENQRRAAAQFPSARVLPVPNVGHSVLVSDTSGCAVRGLTRFVLGGAPRACARPEADLALALPFFRSLGQVPRARGRLPERVERTATAVDLTLQDAFRWVEAGSPPTRPRPAYSAPGLRGGTVRALRTGPIELVRYELVPGVRVSGRIASRGRLRISGRGATGTLTISPSGRITGVLDGVVVRYRPLAIEG